MFSYEEIKIDSNKGTCLKDDFFEGDTKEETKDEPVSQEKMNVKNLLVFLTLQYLVMMRKEK